MTDEEMTRIHEYRKDMTQEDWDKIRAKHKTELNITVEYRKKIRKLWKKEYESIRPEVVRIATEQGHMKDGRVCHKGACHYVWAIEKQVMKEKFGVTWYSEQDIHPDSRYD